MNENAKNLLNEEIESRIRELAYLKLGSEEYSKAVENIAKLYKLRIEETEVELDYDDRNERRIMENSINDLELRQKNEQLEKDVKERYVRFGLEAAGIILPLIFYSNWMRKGLKFEETGTFTSATFRGLINRFRPTGK
jgi:hypothetical protein